MLDRSGVLPDWGEPCWAGAVPHGGMAADLPIWTAWGRPFLHTLRVRLYREGAPEQLSLLRGGPQGIVPTPMDSARPLYR